MSYKLSDWQPASQKPQLFGFYEVEHSDAGWCRNKGDVHARWTGEKWERPVGWRAPPAGSPSPFFDRDKNGKLTIVECNVWKDVNVTRWRGLL